MVYLVQMAKGLSEKGAGKRGLPDCSMLVEMAQHVAWHRKHEPLIVLYCDDGAGYGDIMSSVERKVLERLLQQWCPGLNIVGMKFSFHDDRALQLLEIADVFYFKGFGGGTDRLLPIFGKAVPRDSEMADRVTAFQNKCMFDGMLAFMVCGAAIITGTHYPGDDQLEGLKLLGDAYVQYHANESIAAIEVSKSNNVIQLCKGVANIISCRDGLLGVKVEVIAKSEVSTYWPFAKQCQLHLTAVMIHQHTTWRIYTWVEFGQSYFWACRTDGKSIRGSREDVARYCAQLPDHLSRDSLA